MRVSVGASASEASVAVSDQGIGIDAADMHKLFTRFGRIVTPENSHIPGTGLGLYLARELARLHGGDVIVRSWPMLGSSFVFTMPVPATAGDLAASGSALLQ